jgi:hypothetical protein
MDLNRISDIIKNKKPVKKTTLPEVTVYTHKDKQTRDFYNNLLSKWEGYEQTLPYADYKALMKLNEKVGFPKVREVNDPNFRSYYNVLTDRMSIPKGDIKDYIEELSHAKQVRDNGGKLGFIKKAMSPAFIKSIGKGLPNILKGKSPYDASYKEPGTIEYEAHKKISPKLMDYFMNQKVKYAWGEDELEQLSEKEKKQAISNMKGN